MFNTFKLNRSSLNSAIGRRGAWQRTFAWTGDRPTLSAGVVVATVTTSLLLQACAKEIPPPSRTFDSSIAYFETVNRSADKVDPSVIFVLMGQYLNANQQVRGMAYYSKYMKDNDSRLSGPSRALYLSAMALLRASHAQRIPLLDRTGWVRETVAMLEEAKRLSRNRIFLVRWIAGVVYARLPSSFGKEQAALVELNWSLENMSKAPHAGWAREVNFHLALVHRNRDEAGRARAYLAKSRYSSFDRPITTTTLYAVNAREGLRFYPRRIREVVPGRVFAVSGFEFTEYYFIISSDGKELIAIDAGARPDSAEAVIQALKQRVPGLPPLTTVFVTHAHWDHIGGQRAFRRIYPNVRFVIRNNYQDELKRSINAPGVYGIFLAAHSRLPMWRILSPNSLCGPDARCGWVKAQADYDHHPLCGQCP